MNALTSVWLPILLSAVVVFVISSLIHMVLKWHSKDYGALTNEDAVREAIRAGNPTPGRYVMPQCKEMKDMATPEMKRKYEEGPVAHLTVLPNGAPKMGKYLGQWFLWSLVVSIVAAYLAVRIYDFGHPNQARGAAKLVGAITFIAHGFGTVTESIWTGRPWGQTVKYLIDAALYGAGAGAVFYYMWP
jgi:hypothetical protein